MCLLPNVQYHFVLNVEFLNGISFLKNLGSRKDFWSSQAITLDKKTEVPKGGTFTWESLV